VDKLPSEELPPGAVGVHRAVPRRRAPHRQQAYSRW
jgi:hypothetical protein